MSDLNRQHNRVVWTDIPVVNLERAVKFYREVLDISVAIESFGDVSFAVLEHERGNGGCLVVAPDNVTTKGPLNYFNVHGRIYQALAKAKNFGASVIEEIQAIGPHGYRAVIIDSEGNRIALHSEIDE
jgi:uncharacterized protein